MENKFRAWDEDKHKYLFWDKEKEHIVILQSGGIRIQNGKSSNCPEFANRNIIIEFYTGLKDKKGKEIYKGDKIIDSEDREMIVCWSDRSAGFCLSSKGWAYNHFFNEACDAEECEVIGTIHG